MRPSNVRRRGVPSASAASPARSLERDEREQPLIELGQRLDLAEQCRVDIQNDIAHGLGACVVRHFLMGQPLEESLVPSRSTALIQRNVGRRGEEPSEYRAVDDPDALAKSPKL
jgi:hypothetical protein